MAVWCCTGRKHHDVLLVSGRTAQTVREDIEYLMTLYNSSSALLRIADRPVYYVYDSYHLLPQQWSTLLSPDGSRTVRGTTLDGEFKYCLAF